ncbi:hypothetical protein [Bdellovibrio sp. HCB274]|uniref:hypothetical protein n=1 Tax=Bdellovibrio sp. HCB274 TaxID=3394361 RepID=UPI0039B5447A
MKTSTPMKPGHISCSFAKVTMEPAQMKTVRFLALLTSIFCLFGTNIAVAQVEYSVTSSLEKNSAVQPVTASQQVSKMLNTSGSSKALGGVDTGGGTIVNTPNGPGLLDLYLYNPSAFADRRMNSNSFVQDERSRKIGISLLSNFDQPVMRRASRQIDKWLNSSPALIDRVGAALNRMTVYVHNGTFASLPKEYYLPAQANIPAGKLKMVALYVSGFGVNISATDFNSLPELHQTALIIHEALRYLKDQRILEISNQTMQMLTAKIMSDPLPNESLDRIEYFSRAAKPAVSQYQSFLDESELLKESFCKKYYWAPAALPCDRKINASDISNLLNATQRALDEIPEKTDLHAKIYGNYVDQQYFLADTSMLTIIHGSNDEFREPLKSNAQYILDRYFDGELKGRQHREVQSTVKAYFKGRGIEIHYSK